MYKCIYCKEDITDFSHNCQEKILLSKKNLWEEGNRRREHTKEKDDENENNNKSM